jgi:ABC-2 type transport system ATP-binding protein
MSKQIDRSDARRWTNINRKILLTPNRASKCLLMWNDCEQEVGYAGGDLALDEPMDTIEINDVSKAFSERWVLKGVSFSVRKGEVFGYLGPNGAGKTTTMRIILGLLRPTAGTALVNGHDLGSDDEARRSIGVLMENDGLYERLSAKQNLDYYARLYRVQERERKIDDLLKTFGLSDRGNDKVFNFSKGMRRKLGIARAIVNDPEILLMDEPTSGLDPEAQKMVRDILTDLSKKERMTVLLSSHNLDEVQRICSRVAVIKSGVIRACDTVDNLRGGKGTHNLTVVASSPQDAQAASSVLRSVHSVVSSSVEGSEVALTHVDESSAGVIASLVKAGVRLEEVRRSNRSLEDVYIDLVKEQGEEVVQ